MKIHRRITLYLLAGTSFMSLMSCTKNFAEINRRMDGVTREELMGDNNLVGALFPSMEALIVPLSDRGAFQHCESLTGDVYGRNMIAIDDWAGEFSYFTYDGTHWLDNPFNFVLSFYTSYSEACRICEYQGINYAWARIMRVAAMHRLADQYGPIPYSQVSTNSLHVGYDDDDTVYKTMLEELDMAIDDMEGLVASWDGTLTMANFDRIYGGDWNRWLKFANSLMLRLAVRISNPEPELARHYAEKAIAGGVIESNSDNAFYNMTIGRMASVESAFWGVAIGYNDSRACADLLCYMQGYSDPRLSAYFLPAELNDGITGTRYAGVRAGSMCNTTDFRKHSAPRVSQYDPYPILTASEVAFLRAEGAMKGWSMGGSAKEFYEKGITLSFEQWNVGGAADYKADNTRTQADFSSPIMTGESCNAVSNVTVAWDDAAGNEASASNPNYERLMVQKYIALYPLGHETWCDYRRTGLPNFFPVFRQVETKYQGLAVASRLPFPVKEQENNAENLQAAVSMLSGEDDFATKLWWAKK
ncbi:MAG: SusD/RagB family nutrient-binding outer membrane lipoprotein [Clostridium sp.]|nr:SusD/RagB family nutrient-binding outer membrane lipoprotein [Bacteroides sp.]MCM1199132.1 SusD/RagB family nutrient-binding outer membrane lipoprotein [Clostridium sp.]